MQRNGVLDLLSLIRNFRVHYDQQPLHIRQSIFNHGYIDSNVALTEYHSYFDRKFPGFFQFMYDALFFSKSSSFSQFYLESCSTEILIFQNCFEIFRQLFKMHYDHDLKYDRFRNLFTVGPDDQIKINFAWIDSTVTKFDLKEKLNQQTPNSYYDFLFR